MYIIWTHTTINNVCDEFHQIELPGEGPLGPRNGGGPSGICIPKGPGPGGPLGGQRPPGPGPGPGPEPAPSGGGIWGMSNNDLGPSLLNWSL